MAKRKGGARGRQPNMPRRQNNGGSARAQNSTGVRTVTIASVSPRLADISAGNMPDWQIQGSMFPGLKAHLDHAIEWRVRSARVVFTSTASTSGFSVAALLAPVGTAWKPVDWTAMEVSGGVIKPVKNSGWSTNNLGAQEGWTNHANSAGVLYMAGIGAPATALSCGVVTLHATVQLRGNR